MQVDIFCVYLRLTTWASSRKITIFLFDVTDTIFARIGKKGLLYKTYNLWTISYGRDFDNNYDKKGVSWKNENSENISDVRNS